MRKPLKKITVSILVTLWVLASLMLVSGLLLEHNVVYWPNLDLQGPPKGSSWALTHVLGVDCKCSQIVSQYLLKRGSASHLQERIVMLGQDLSLKSRLQQRGFEVDVKDEKYLSQNEMATGVPFLMITNKTGQTVYAGGYGEHKILDGDTIRDLEILAQVQAGQSSKKFPIIGCATSLKYQNLLDPFHLKYSKGDSNP